MIREFTGREEFVKLEGKCYYSIIELLDTFVTRHSIVHKTRETYVM
jgi:hypothetical protein